MQGYILNKDRKGKEHTDYVLSDGVNQVIIELEDNNFILDPNQIYEIARIIGKEKDDEYDGVGDRIIEIMVTNLRKIVAE